MPSPDPQRSAPASPSRVELHGSPSVAASPNRRPFTPLVTGLWLIVDALAILGISVGIAAWFLAGSRQTLLISQVVAGALCAAAGILAAFVWRRGRAEVAAVARVDSQPNRPAQGRGGDGETGAGWVIGGAAIKNLRDLRQITAQTCCQHSDGSGKVHSDASRAYFAHLDLVRVAPLLAAAELKTANEFHRLLDRIAHGIGAPSSPELDQLRAAIPQLLTPSLTQVADTLGAAQDPQLFREALVDACFEHQDCRGRPVTWGLGILLSRIKPQQLTTMFGAARPKMLAGMARVVSLLSRSLTSPCAELELLRTALIDAGRAKLPVSQQAEWIVPFIAGLCCEHSDGGGKVDREAAQRLFQGMSFQRLGDRLSHLPLRELNTVARALSRMAAGLEEPQPAGFRLFLRAVDESIELAALRFQPRLLAAQRLTEFRQAIVEACCECDDASGFHNRRPLVAMLDGIDAERFSPLIDAATPAERLQFSQLVRRIDVDRRGEGDSPALQRLQELLGEGIAADHPDDRSVAAIPTTASEPALAERSPAGRRREEAAEADQSSEAMKLTWQDFKQANLAGCSPALSQAVARLLDQIARDGEEGLRRVVRRLWRGLRRDGNRLMVDLAPDELPAEWARKRYLAEALTRSADRRAVPRLIDLLEGDCVDPEYRDTVQPAIARALIAMRDRRAVEALQRVKRAPHLSSATLRVIASSKSVARYERELPP